MPWIQIDDGDGVRTVWQDDPAPAGMVSQQYDGGGGGGYDSRLIADTSKYTQTRSAKGGEILEIFNPDTGQWEKGVYDIANPDVRLPESVAARLGIRSAPALGHVASKSNIISELASDPNFVQFALTALGGAYSGGAFDGLLGSGSAAGAGAADAAFAADVAASGAADELFASQLFSGGNAAAGGALTQVAQGYGGISDVVPIFDGIQNAGQGLQLGSGGTGLSATGGMPSVGFQASPGALEGLSGGLSNAGAATAADAAAASMGGSIAAGLTPAAAATVPNWLTGSGFGSGSSAGTGVSVPGVTMPTTPSAPQSPSTSMPPAPAVNTSNLATKASAGSALSRFLNGTATAADYISLGMPLAGALLGGTSANNKPAGTTTTIQDVPDWQKPYLVDLFNSAKSTYQNQATDQTAQNLNNAGAANLQSTLAGNFLSPDSNPYLQATFDKAARSLTDQYNYTTMPQLSRSFGNQQAFGGSSAYGEAFGKANQGLATGLADLGTGIYGGNYQTERGRQFTGALSAPDYAASYRSSPYAGLNAYGNIVGRQYGSQTQEPYFTNPVGGALSGALGGLALSNAFGK